MVAGINPDQTGAGFHNAIIQPQPGGGITNVFASLATINGNLISTWTNNPAQSSYSLTVTVPANTTASVYLPSPASLANITESGLPATNAPGVFYYYTTNFPNFSAGATVFQVGSGQYKFKVSNISL